MRTSEVKAALRGYYKSPEYALMFEVASTTGAMRARRADAIAMNLWPSRGLLIEGIEIKVSRSDWRRELDNPAKAEEIAQYCDQWWIVAPKGIVQDHEVPALWGYKVVSEGGMIRTVKQAPKQDVEPLTRNFVAGMLRRASEADEAEINAMVERRVASAREDIQKQIDREVSRRSERYEKLVEKMDVLKEHGVDLSDRYGTGSAESIARWIAIGKAFEQDYHVSGLEHTATGLRKAADTIDSVHQMIKGVSRD